MQALLPTLLALMVSSAAPEAVLDGVFCRQDTLDTQLTFLQFRSDMRYTESDLKSGDVKLLECKRLVSVPRFGEQSHEYEEVCLNGVQLEGKERDKEIKSLRSKAKYAQRTLMPFFPETRDEYEYRVARRDTWRGMQVWRIEFTPVRRTGRHITGYARVLDGSFDIVSLEFAPSDLPFLVTDASMALNYERTCGHWLPASFEMDMDLRLAFFIELMRMHVRIDEIYRDYSFTDTTTVRDWGNE